MAVRGPSHGQVLLKTLETTSPSPEKVEFFTLTRYVGGPTMLPVRHGTNHGLAARSQGRGQGGAQDAVER